MLMTNKYITLYKGTAQGFVWIIKILIINSFQSFFLELCKELKKKTQIHKPVIIIKFS